MEGWIKLHRKLLTDPVWCLATDAQKVVLITVLLLANHESRQWVWKGEKYEVRPGQLITSLANLATAAGVSVQNVRSTLKRFSSEPTRFLTNESTKTGRLITIVNWDTYQCCGDGANKDLNKDPTKTQQRPNIDPTPNKNERRKEGKKEPKDSCSEPVPDSKPEDSPGTPLLEIPTNKSGEVFVLTEEQVEGWRPTYPAVDVVGEIRKAVAWLDANPAKRKTKRGMKAFLVNWLNRAQDRGGTKGPTGSVSSSSKPFWMRGDG